VTQLWAEKGEDPVTQLWAKKGGKPRDPKGDREMAKYTTKRNYIELHISGGTEFTRKHGAKVREAGGSFRRIKPSDMKRAVFLPLTRRGIELAEEVCAAYPMGGGGGYGEWRTRTVVMIRGTTTIHSKPGRIARSARRFAIECADRVRAARVRRAEQDEIGRRNARARDAAMVHETSLEAGERMAAEFLFG